jgi:hypothetical protein
LQYYGEIRRESDVGRRSRVGTGVDSSGCLMRKKESTGGAIVRFEPRTTRVRDVCIKLALDLLAGLSNKKSDILRTGCFQRHKKAGTGTHILPLLLLKPTTI